MRTKLLFQGVFSDDEEEHLYIVNISHSLTNFIDLHEHLYQKFDLQKHLSTGESLVFYIDQCQIPFQEEIKNILTKEDEILTIKKSMKRQNSVAQFGEMLPAKKIKPNDQRKENCSFCQIIDSISYLRNCFSVRNTNSPIVISASPNSFPNLINESNPWQASIANQKKSDFSTQIEEPSQANRKAPSCESSESEKLNHKLDAYEKTLKKPPKGTVEKFVITKPSQASKPQNVNKKEAPAAKDNITSKPINPCKAPASSEPSNKLTLPQEKLQVEQQLKKQVVQKKRKISESSSSESSSSSDPEVVRRLQKPPENSSLVIKKTIQVNPPIKLNILDPEDEFAQKKKNWKSQPIPQKKDNFNSENKGGAAGSKPFNFQHQERKNNFQAQSRSFQAEQPNRGEYTKDNFRQHFMRGSNTSQSIDLAKTHKEQPKGLALINPSKEVFFKINLTRLGEYWKSKGNIFLEPTDEVCYKTHILCRETFTPKVSDFKEDTIEEVSADSFTLKYKPKSKTKEMTENPKREEEEEEEEEEQRTFKISEIIELHVKKDKLGETRLKILKENGLCDDLLSKDEKSTDASNKQDEKAGANQQKKNEYSKEGFITKQVNYYFSDKNYYTDEYILAHTVKNPEKQFPTKLLLNFPKLKSAIDNYEKLVLYLRNFCNSNPKTCNYILSEDGSFIRKKDLKEI